MPAVRECVTEAHRAHHLRRRVTVKEDALPDFKIDEQPQRVAVIGVAEPSDLRIVLSNREGCPYASVSLRRASA